MADEKLDRVRWHELEQRLDAFLGATGDLHDDMSLQDCSVNMNEWTAGDFRDFRCVLSLYLCSSAAREEAA